VEDSDEKESPAEAGCETEKGAETPRLKAGAKKSPLKRAKTSGQQTDGKIQSKSNPKACFSRLFFAPCFSRGVMGRFPFTSSALQRGFS
jgi:hypothetical protein